MLTLISKGILFCENSGEFSVTSCSYSSASSYCENQELHHFSAVRSKYTKPSGNVNDVYFEGITFVSEKYKCMLDISLNIEMTLKFICRPFPSWILFDTKESQRGYASTVTVE